MRAQHSDLFVATSHFYADSMSDFLDLDRERIKVTRLGISFDGYREEVEVNGNQAAGHSKDRFDIGFLARVCPEKGLHNLVDAFVLLAQRRSEQVALHVAGYIGGRDRRYLEQQQAKLAAAGLSESVRFWGEVDRDQKLEFLHGLDVLSVPTEYHEPKGLSVLESLAAGVPVVQPSHGSFPELLERTGGGWLVEPNNPQALADQLEAVMDDEQARVEKARLAYVGVRREYGQELMARETVEAYRHALSLPATRIEEN